MKKLNTGRNQTYARTLNNELVIQALRKEDLSATELSEKLSLSNAAMSSIMKGLLEQGIIKISYTKSESGKGRKQIVYSLNESYGLIIVVSLSDNRYTITISNISNGINIIVISCDIRICFIFKMTIFNNRITYHHSYKTANKIFSWNFNILDINII